jgi:hypothetical protein
MRGVLVMSVMVGTSVGVAEERRVGAREPSVKLPPELARVLTEYEAALRAGDGRSLARLFDEDGFVLPNGAPPVRGRAAIQQDYKGPGGPLVLRALAFATERSSGLLARVDHLVYAAPDLDAAIERLEGLLGVRATPGGQHPGRGTRNALIALGPATYLEILGPDPAQPKPATSRWFGIDDLQAPRLAGWAAKGIELERLVEDAGRHGVKLGEVHSGSRRRADGVLLSWRFTDPFTVVAEGIVPFFIDWGDTPHPAASAAKGVSLIALRAEHPDPEQVSQMLDLLGLDLPVRAGSAPALVAILGTPRGRIELR